MISEEGPRKKAAAIAAAAVETHRQRHAQNHHAKVEGLLRCPGRLLASGELGPGDVAVVVEGRYRAAARGFGCGAGGPPVVGGGMSAAVEDGKLAVTVGVRMQRAGRAEPEQHRGRDSIHHGGLVVPIAGGVQGWRRRVGGLIDSGSLCRCRVQGVSVRCNVFLWWGPRPSVSVGQLSEARRDRA